MLSIIISLEKNIMYFIDYSFILKGKRCREAITAILAPSKNK